MQKGWIICVVMVVCAATSVSAQKETYQDRVKKYIDQFKDLAVSEQRRSGVPAAITLAQGIHETMAGSSELALNANNHFGIKCKKEWQGKTYAYTDDAPNECFRKYDAPILSYRDHSDYLTGSPRYASLFKLQSTDYKNWAIGLKKAGYATNPKYADILIKIVEDYQLQDYTNVAMKPQLPQTTTPVYASAANTLNNPKPVDATPKPSTPSVQKKGGMQVSYGETEQAVKKVEDVATVPNPVKLEYNQLVKVHGLKAFLAKKGTVLLNEAIKYDIRYAKLLELNDLADAPLEADMYIYLEKKNTKGLNATHLVKEGETLTQIAQSEGLQLKYLKFYNRIGGNEEPVVGSVLQLQQYSENKPITYAKDAAPREAVSEIIIAQNPVKTQSNLISKKEIEKTELKEQQEKTQTKDETIAAKEKTKVKESKQKATAVAATTPSKNVPSDLQPITAMKEEKVEEPKIQKPAPEIIQTVAVSSPILAQEKPATIPTPSKLPEVKNEHVEAMSNEEAQEEGQLDLMVSAGTASNEVKGEKTDEETQFSIANEKAVEEEMQGPQDEFTKLKAKLDRVVYASDKAVVKNIPSDETKSTQTEVKPQVVKDKIYTVKKGDTVFSIAKKHNVTVSQLRDWNKLDFNAVKVGQHLKVKL